MQPDLMAIFRGVDRDGSGSISTAELQSALSNGTHNSFNPETCRLMIGMFDANCDGAIEFREFQALWNYVNDWTACFRSFDTDGSGNIDRGELTNALTRFGYRLSGQFYTILMNKFDRTHSGSINFDDFIQLCVVLQTLTAAFRDKDQDRDGVITIRYEEFLTMSVIMSLNRNNASTAAVSSSESIKSEDEHSPADTAEELSSIFNQFSDLSLSSSSSSETSKVSTPIDPSQMDELTSLDTLPTPPMDAICRFLLDAEDYEALANLRKTNRACKAGVDSFFIQKKNIPPMESVDVRLTDFVLEFKLDVHKDTRSFRPYLKDLKNHLHNGMPQYFIHKTSYSVFRIVIQRVFRGYEVLETIKKVVGDMRFLSVSLSNLEHLRFLERDLFERTAKFDKLRIEWNEKEDNLKIDDEFSVLLDSMITNRSIGELELNILTRSDQPNYGLADPTGFFERLAQRTKKVTIAEHNYLEYNRVPLLFGLAHDEWKSLISRLEKNGARAQFYINRGVFLGASTRRTILSYQAALNA